MERVIVNLAGNALRYSPLGTPPLLTARAHGDRVELHVVDCGPGIPRTQCDQAFLPFQQLGEAGQSPGVGLGLALSRGLTEAMGGTLEPRETPGGGLTMVISLPAATITAVRAAAPELVGVKPLDHALWRGETITCPTYDGYRRPTPSIPATRTTGPSYRRPRKARPCSRAFSGPATESAGHEKRWALAGESTGVRAARLTAVERTGPETPAAPGGQDTDRLIIVTEGQLDTEIAGRSAGVPAEAVIVIPAGVPHRIWNSSAAPVRYLDIDLQAPAAYAKLALAE
jgi:hypothetical protein